PVGRADVMGVRASAPAPRSPMVGRTTPAPSSVGICTVVIRAPAHGPAVSTWPGRSRCAGTAPSASGCTSSTVDSITRTSSGGRPRSGPGHRQVHVLVDVPQKTGGDHGAPLGVVGVDGDGAPGQGTGPVCNVCGVEGDHGWLSWGRGRKTGAEHPHPT